MNMIALNESSPEKAGVGGSIPSLATTFSIAYEALTHSAFSFHFIPKRSRGTIRLVWNAGVERSGAWQHASPLCRR